MFPLNAVYGSPSTLYWMENIDGEVDSKNYASAYKLAILNEEQRVLDRVRERLANRISELNKRSEDRPELQKHHQNRMEQEAISQHNQNVLRHLELAIDRPIIGRIDLATGEGYHIGRIGLSDANHLPMVIDWRAPIASAFYQASLANPMGLSRRRNLRCEDHKVIRVSDEIYDRTLIESSILSEDSQLLEALNLERTSRMGDIIATIQSEQDRIMRSEYAGLVLINGGPGTGKTVVALHRAAYLLYTNREKLARRGVLIIGPNREFLDYISEVLPSMGEDKVVLSTIGSLYPGISSGSNDAPEICKIKGDKRMALVLKNAVINRVRIPESGVELYIDGHRLYISNARLRKISKLSFDQEQEYNSARLPFLTKVLEILVEQLCEIRGQVPEDEYTRSSVLDELRENSDVRRKLNLMWMPMSPEQLIIELVERPNNLFNAAKNILTEKEMDLITKSGPQWSSKNWSIQDVPLLDEAAELLGEVPIRTVSANSEYGEIESSYDNIYEYNTISERAAQDRNWKYGHLVVDEAQELSPMAWRMLLRKVPLRSATVVGDLEQQTTPGAISNWSDVTSCFSKFEIEHLNINYRTPSKVMNLATKFIVANGGEVLGAVSAREVEDCLVISREKSAVQESLRILAAEPQKGTLALITADGEIPSEIGSISGECRVLKATESKGLEFDRVIIWEPNEIFAKEGRKALYVALTRATKKLYVLAPSGNLPKGLL